AGEAHIPLDDLQVGITDTRSANPEQYLITLRSRNWYLMIQAQLIVKYKPTHPFYASACAAPEMISSPFNSGISPFSQATSSGTAVKIEEYVPHSKPISRMAMNCLMVSPPNNRMAIMM